MADILVVDDDQDICRMLETRLGRSGHTPTIAHTLANAMELAERGDFDIVLLDVQMPDGNGLEFIPRFKGLPSSPEVIIFTGRGDHDGADKAIMSGAWDYIEKVNVIKELTLPLTRALEFREEKRKSRATPIHLKRDKIIGHSAKMNACFDILANAAGSDANVLITGETGTGKELFARALHENSSRAGQNIITVDCAALPESLIESALFGHARGAFTGADRARDGLIKHADGGTLFLDEIGELPLSMQKTFLRVLQEHRYRPVGALEEQSSNFRVVAATNRDLEECVRQGTFRSDLYFRLKAFTIHLPPLRERKEDMLELTVHCIKRLCTRMNVELKGVSPDFIEALTSYDWPGNVRELFQTMEQVFAGGNHTRILFPQHLPERIRISHTREYLRTSNGNAIRDNCRERETDLMQWRQAKDKFEENYISRLMQRVQGDTRKACEISGISKARLYQLLGKYNQIPSRGLKSLSN
jgi:two-component system NtrC family response regulator